MQHRNTRLAAAICLLLLIVSSAAAQGVTVLGWSNDDNGIRKFDIIGRTSTSPTQITVTGKTLRAGYGLARDPQTGTAYGVVEFSDSAPGIRSLVSVNLSTGAASVIGAIDDGTGISIAAITVTENGLLLGISESTSSSNPGMVFAIDKQTATATAVVPLAAYGTGQGIAFDIDEGLVYVLTGGSELVLQWFDPASPEAGIQHLALGFSSTYPTSLLQVGRKRFVFITDLGELYLLNAENGTIDDLGTPGPAAGLIGVPTVACPQPGTLYGAGPINGPQFLAIIDRATGNSALVGAIEFNDITGLSFAPDGKLYGLGKRADNSETHVLLTIDQCTGKGTEIAPTAESLNNLSIQADGTALTYSGSTLLQLDLTTGAVRSVGDSVIHADDFGLAFSSADNKLYFARIFRGSGDLFSIDKTTGVSSAEGFLASPPNFDVLRGMDFDPSTNRMYALASEGAGAAPTFLSVMDTEAHAVSVVGATSSDMRTLAFQKPTTSSSDYVLSVIKEGDGDGVVTSLPAGIDCGNLCSFAFAPATEVVLTATPHSGLVFAGWSGACTGTGTCVTTMTTSRLVRARFEHPARFSLNVSKDGTGTGHVISDLEGIDCGSVCKATFPSGAVVTLSAKPAAGSAFSGWTAACTGNTNCQVSMSVDRSLTVTFTQLATFPLSLHNSNAAAGVITGNGISCSSTTCSSTFAQGSVVTLSASANPEWTFTGWSGACTGTACSVTMDAARDVTANFSFVGPFHFPVSAPAPATVNAGQAAVFNIALQQHSANSTALSLACSGLPFGTACSFNPNNIQVGAGTNSTITTQLTISTTAPTFAFAKPNGSSTFLAISVLAAMITWRRRRLAVLLGTVALSFVFLLSCGGGGGGQSPPVKKISQSGTPAGTYTITVTGSAGSTTQSTTVTLTVK